MPPPPRHIYRDWFDPTWLISENEMETFERVITSTFLKPKIRWTSTRDPETSLAAVLPAAAKKLVLLHKLTVRLISKAKQSRPQTKGKCIYFVIDTVQELLDTTSCVCVCVYTHTEEDPPLKMSDNARFDIHAYVLWGTWHGLHLYFRSPSPPVLTALRVTAEIKRAIFTTIKINGQNYLLYS